MYLNSIGYYVPSGRVDNKYFSVLHGLEEGWFEQRTGMKTRSRASDKETIDYMSIKAVKKALQTLVYDHRKVDLIIFASYTPSDTIGTTGHIIQKEFEMHDARVFYLSAGCSSSVNAMEIINSFFKAGTSKRALLVSAERNSTYSDDNDLQNGHLWGDAAAAFFFSNEQLAPNEAKLIDIMTKGLGYVGDGPEAVTLKPKSGGLQMPKGRDVFMQACTYMNQSTKDIVERNEYSLNDLNYFIAHQANQRILSRVNSELGISEQKALSNVREYGNTGCAGALLVFAENFGKFKLGDLICITVFGGGYSVGSCLFVMS